MFQPNNLSGMFLGQPGRAGAAQTFGRQAAPINQIWQHNSTLDMPQPSQTPMLAPPNQLWNHATAPPATSDNQLWNQTIAPKPLPAAASDNQLWNQSVASAAAPDNQLLNNTIAPSPQPAAPENQLGYNTIAPTNTDLMSALATPGVPVSNTPSTNMQDLPTMFNTGGRQQARQAWSNWPQSKG